MGHHPIAWYQYVHGGRSFQTALGHTEASYDDPAFRAHLAGAIAWAAGEPSPRVVLEEFNGVATPGPWDMHQYDGSFDYAVTRDALVMYDRGRGNQHLTRRDVLVDARRRYAVDALFVIHRASRAGLDTPINSFCLNLDVQGADGRADDLAHLYTRAINLDLSSAPGGGGVMKSMGFVDGAFREIGERATSCCDFDRAYRLSAEVNTRADGSLAMDVVTVTLREGARVHERFEVDYTSFPWHPDRTRPVRVGVNTHDTDWTLRDLRVRYLD